MARLLVTGGAGFIGSGFTGYWLRNHPGDRVVVLDALTYAGDARNLAAFGELPAFRFVHGDIRDRARVEDLLREERLDTVVNFAAESHVDRSIADSDEFVATNVAGTHALLGAARRVWLQEGRVARHRFHQVSTDEVYGSRAPGEPAVDERSRYEPNSPYAASKAAADHLVRAFARTYGLEVTTSSSSNNYGPRQFPEKLVPVTILNVIEGQPTPVYGDGRHRREWLHVDDHCRGIDSVLTRGRAGEVYHLGSGRPVENLELVRLLCRLIDARMAADPSVLRRFPRSPAARGARAEELISFVKDRAGHDLRYAVSCEKARHDLGFAAEISLEQGMAETVGWYLDNESWWRAHR